MDDKWSTLKSDTQMQRNEIWELAEKFLFHTYPPSLFFVVVFFCLQSTYCQHTPLQHHTDDSGSNLAHNANHCWDSQKGSALFQNISLYKAMMRH